MPKKFTLLFFTFFVTTSCFFASESDARNPITIWRGLFLDNPARSMVGVAVPGGVPTFSPYSDTGEGEFDTGRILDLVNKFSPKSKESFSDQELHKLRSLLESDQKTISAREFLLRPDPPTVTSNEKLNFEVNILGLIGTRENRDVLYLRPVDFIRTYRSAKRNESCKISGGICITLDARPGASFTIVCDDGSITVSTDGSLSIDLGTSLVSIYMHAGQNK